MSGASFDFNESDSAAAVREYSPALQETLLVIPNITPGLPLDSSLTATPE